MKVNDKEKYRKPITIRLTDFNPIQPNFDPTSTMASAFAIKSTTTRVKSTTPVPRNRRHAVHYSDAKKWERPHNEEIDKLNEMEAIQWIDAKHLPKDNKTVPLTMTY